jgi:methionine-rich copper-binding protein CopC
MPESLNPAASRPVGDHRRHRSSVRSRVVVAHGLLAILLAALGSLIWAPAASAHDELLDLQPGNKVVLSTPPTEVQLVFGAAVLAMGTQIRVTGPKGNVVSTGPVSVDQGTVVEKLTGGLGDGVYRVDWRVTSSDGHPVSGTYTFTLKAAGASSSSSSSVTSTASATASAGVSSTASPSASSTTSASGGTGKASSSGSGSSAVLAVGLLVAAAAVGGIAFALLRRGKGASTSIEGNQNK